MKDFFKGVRKHIDRLDAAHLREQYGLVSDELAFAEMIFNTMDEGYLVLDELGGVSWRNPAATRLLGMDPKDILPNLSLPVGKASKREIALTYPDVKTLAVQTIPMGRTTLVKLADITAERNRTEEEMRAGATRAVRDLASGVAHEIGNPLNAISLNLQLLARERPGDQSVADCIGQIRRLDEILKGFLQALRPSKPNLRAGSIAEPLANCLKVFKQQFEDRRITTTLDIPSALPTVAIDADQMQQVFFNLVKNALEAMHETDTLSIAVTSDDDCVNVVLRDSGSGIDPETLAHLFEPYRTTKEHGTGLGLMISHRIVRDHGGTIDVESAPGEGTTFTVRIPRLERRIRELKQS